MVVLNKTTVIEHEKLDTVGPGCFEDDGVMVSDYNITIAWFGLQVAFHSPSIHFRHCAVEQMSVSNKVPRWGIDCGHLCAAQWQWFCCV